MHGLDFFLSGLDFRMVGQVVADGRVTLCLFLLATNVRWGATHSAPLPMATRNTSW